MAINVGSVYFEARLQTKSLLGDVQILQKQLTKSPVELNIKPIFNKSDIEKITKNFTTIGKKLGRDLGKTIGKDIATQVGKSLKDALGKDLKLASGSGKKIGEQLGDDIAKGAAKGGKKIGEDLADDVAKGAKGGGDKAGKTLADEFSKAFDSTIGDRTTSKIRSAINSLSTSVSKFLPKELGDALTSGVPVIQRSFELWKETGKKEGQLFGDAIRNHFDFGNDLWQQLTGKLPAQASAFAQSLGGQLGKLVPVELSAIAPNLLSTFKGAMIAGAVGIGLGIAGKIGFELAKGLTEAFANAVGTINKFAIDAGKAVIGLVATSVDAAAEVDKQLTLAVGVTGLAAREGMEAAREGIEELRKAVIDVGTDPRFIVTPKGLADSSNILAKAGFQVNQIGESLQQLAAVSTSSGEAVDKVTESFLDSTAKFNLGTEEQAEAMGAFFGTLTSAKLESRELVKSLQYFNPGQDGIAGFQESVRLFGLMATQGLRGSMAATSLNNALNRAHKAAELLGISLFDVNGTRKSQLDLMLEIGETYGDINFQLEENQQLGIDLQKAFGQQGIRAVQAFSKVTKEQIQQVEDAIAGGVTTLGDVSSLMLEQVGAAQVGLDNAIDGILLRIGFATAPIVNSIKVVASGLVNALGSIENVPAWDVLASTSESLSEAFKDPAVQEGIRTINQALADILNASLLRIVDIINYIIEWLGNPEAVHEFVETIKDLISVVEIGLRGAFGVVAFQMETVLSLAATLSETFDQVRAGLEQTQQGINLGEIVEREGAKTQQFFNGIRDRLVEIAQNPEFQSFLQRIPPFILQVKNSLERTLKPVIDSIVQFLEVNGASLGQLALQLLGIIGDIAPIVGQVLAIAIDLVSIVTQGVTKALEVVPVIDIISTGISAISVAVEGVLNLIRQILSVFLEVQDGALSTLAGVTQGFRDSLALARAGLSSFGNDLFDVFENIGDAIGEAIKNAISISLQWAIDRIGEVFDRVTGLGQNAELQARQARDRELGISTPTQRATRRAIEASAIDESQRITTGIEDIRAASAQARSDALIAQQVRLREAGLVDIVENSQRVIDQAVASARYNQTRLQQLGSSTTTPGGAIRGRIARTQTSSSGRAELEGLMDAEAVQSSFLQFPDIDADAIIIKLEDVRNGIFDLSGQAYTEYLKWGDRINQFFITARETTKKYSKQLKKEVEDRIKGIKKSINRFFMDLDRQFKKEVENKQKQIENTTNRVINYITKKLEEIRNYIVRVIDFLRNDLLSKTQDTFRQIVQYTIEQTQRIKANILAIVSEIVNQIINQFNNTLLSIQNLIDRTTSFIQIQVLDKLSSIWQGVINGAQQAIQQVGAIFQQGWQGIVNNALGIISGFGDSVRGLLSQISFDGITQSLLGIRDAALNALSGFRDWASTLNPISLTIGSIQSVINRISSGISNIVSSLGSINVDIIGRLQSVVNRGSPWGENTERHPMAIFVRGKLVDVQTRNSPWGTVSESNPVSVPIEGRLLDLDLDAIPVDLVAKDLDISSAIERISSGVTLDDLYERAGTYRFGEPVRGQNEHIFEAAGLSQALVDLLKATEGFYANRYLDPTGTPTIGFGTAATAGETARKWLELGTITVEQANEALLEEIEGKDLIGQITRALDFDPNVNQLSALISLAYNGGFGAVLDLIAKGGTPEQIAQNFPTHYTTSYGVPLQGLRTRRLLERELFVSEPIVEAVTTPAVDIAAMLEPNITGVNLADVGALDLNRLFSAAVTGAIEVANGQQSDVAQAVLDAATGYIGEHFNPGVIAQCMAFVRAVLAKANSNLGNKLDTLVNQVTTEAIDGLTTSSLLASSLFGGDIGEIITDRSQLKPGDLVAFYDTYSGWWSGRGAPTITHVAVYAGQDPTTGEQMIIDRSTSSRPVNYRPLDTFAQFAAGVRPFEYGASTTDTAMVVNREAIQLDFTKLTEALKSSSVEAVIATFNQVLADAEQLGIDDAQVDLIRSLIAQPDLLQSIASGSGLDLSAIPSINMAALSSLPGFDATTNSILGINDAAEIGSLSQIAVTQSQQSILEKIFQARGFDVTELSDTLKEQIDKLINNFGQKADEISDLLGTLPSRLSEAEREALIQAGILRTGSVRFGEEYVLPQIPLPEATGNPEGLGNGIVADPFLVTTNEYFADIFNLVVKTLEDNLSPQGVMETLNSAISVLSDMDFADVTRQLSDALQSGSLESVFEFLAQIIPADALESIGQAVSRFVPLRDPLPNDDVDSGGVQETLIKLGDAIESGSINRLFSELAHLLPANWLNELVATISRVDMGQLSQIGDLLRVIAPPSLLSTSSRNDAIDRTLPDLNRLVTDVGGTTDEIATLTNADRSSMSSRIANRLSANNPLRFQFTGVNTDSFVRTNQLKGLERSLNSPDFLESLVDKVLGEIENDPQLRSQLGLI